MKFTLFLLLCFYSISYGQYQSNSEDLMTAFAPLSTSSKIVRAGMDTTIVKDGYTLTISGSDNIVSLQVSQGEYDNWNNNDSGFNNSAHRDSISTLLYSFFEDKFDFIFFINNEETKPTSISYYGQLMHMQNSIEGIGMNIYDYTASTGSGGKLQSVIHLPYLKAIQNGPTLHELAHTWANFIKSFEMASPNGNYPSIPHWGWASLGGQLGGFDKSTLQELGNNLYQANSGRPGATSFGGNANGGNGLAYGPWEMYLAGFWPLDSVEDIIYFEGITTPNELYSEGKFNATHKLTYTKDAMIAEHGPRIPNAQNSQKHFTMLPVVLTPAPLTDSQWSIATEQVAWFTHDSADNTTLYNFFEATRGIGDIDSDNLRASLIGAPTAVTHSMQSTALAPISITLSHGTLYLGGTVQGYRILKANGVLLQEQKGGSYTTISLQNSLSRGVYLVQLLARGSWQQVETLRVH